MHRDAELDLLRNVTSTGEVFNSVLIDDYVHDWTVVKQFGELLVSLIPDHIVSHLVLVRAYRHLGDRSHASMHLEACRAVIGRHPSSDEERETLMPILEAEEQLQSKV